MKNLGYCRILKLGSASVALGIALLAAPAVAQDADEPQAAAEEVVDTGIGGGSAIFDNRGRFFYLGFKANY